MTPEQLRARGFVLAEAWSTKTKKGKTAVAFQIWLPQVNAREESILLAVTDEDRVAFRRARELDSKV